MHSIHKSHNILGITLSLMGLTVVGRANGIKLYNTSIFEQGTL